MDAKRMESTARINKNNTANEIRATPFIPANNLFSSAKAPKCFDGKIYNSSGTDDSSQNPKKEVKRGQIKHSSPSDTSHNYVVCQHDHISLH